MAGGKHSVGGSGARRGRPRKADAAGKQSAATRGTKSMVKRSGGKRAVEAMPGVRGPDAAAGHGELAELRAPADVQRAVRKPVRASGTRVAPLRVPGAGGGVTLSDLLPKDLAAINREHMAQALLHAARQCEKVGNFAQMAQSLRTATQTMGFLEAPEAAEAVDPEERKRKICEAAASYGMVFKKEGEAGEG
jgi:hypothetical protein